MSANTKVTKTKTTLKQETYNLSDLKHDLHCGFKLSESNLAEPSRSTSVSVSGSESLA
jgi:hypothetical protein